MSKKESPVSVNGIGEIGTIRDILMGQHIAEFEKRFAHLDSIVKQVESDLHQRLGELDDQVGQRANQLEGDIDKRFGKLESQLNSNVQQLESQIEKISRSDRHRLGKMLAKVSQQLLED